MDGLPYHQLWMHRRMLNDHVRNEVYRKAIFETVKHGDVVLDFGAGTGILSIFSVHAGAKKVYAIERTGIAALARQVVANNEAESHVEIIQSNVENVKLPEKVDIIVSEWLGGYGVDENMLTPLLVARDLWLKPDGKILPNLVTAWMVPVWDSELDNDMNFWRSRPYEVDLSSIAYRTAQEQHFCHYLSKNSLLSEPQLMWTTDIYKFPTAESRLPFRASLSFTATSRGKLNALAVWFRAEFSGRIILTNAPDAPRTHWGQYVFPLERTIEIEFGTKILVEFICEPSGIGYCHNKWSIRVEDGPCESHDTRMGYLW